MSLVDDGLVSPAMQAWLQAYGSEACEKSLAQFLIEAWPVIDPGTPLVWGHPMDAIADHLQAVDSGHITRLLITIFPGPSPISLS